MTSIELELSKKLLHAQEELLKISQWNDKLTIALCRLIRRVDALETVVEGMCIGRGSRGEGAEHAP